MHKKPWRVRRKVGTGINEASAVLHAMDPTTYSSPDSWAKSLGQKGRADITPNTLAERAFELASRRQKGKSLIFVIDEVGQYVSRSVEKMLDLQAVVQAFGKEGKNRVEAKKAAAPFWRSQRDAVLKPLIQRAAMKLDLREGAAVCNLCGATVGQMETDITAVDAIRDQVIKKIQEMAAPDEKIERVRVSTIFTGKLETEGDIDAALSRLKEHLLKLLSSGIKIILE